MSTKFLEKQLAKKLGSTVSMTGIQHLFRPLYGGIGHILTFHRVLPLDDKLRIHNHQSLEVSPELLENTILFFQKKGYNIISLDEMLENFDNFSSNKRFVVFTFDDGYIDNLEHALPVCNAYNVPMTVYVTSSFPEHGAILWWYYLEELVIEHDLIDFSWKNINYRHVVETQQQKELAFYELRSTFINTTTSEQEKIDLLKILFQDPSFDPYRKVAEVSLSWELVKEMSQHPLVTIGSHTVSHAALAKLEKQDAIQEMVQSRETLESFTGEKIDHFCYPFGSRNEAAVREFDIARDAGFKTAVTTRFSNIFPQHKAHLQALPRLSVNALVNTGMLKLMETGFLPAIRNKFSRFVTN
ncbi:MAG: polysaccharide deacetylase family protein [Bacteroidota bacterium]